MLKTLKMADSMAKINANPAIRLVDVRTREEYRSGHLPKAINLPLHQIREISKIAPVKTTPIFVYCAHGMRAEQAGLALVQLGYLDVTTIGGIADYTGILEY